MKDTTIKKNVTGYEPVRNHSKVNESNINESKVINIITKGKESGAEAPAFKKMTEKDFINSIAEFKENYPREMLRAFFNYWSEKDGRGKMKFQLQKTWEVKKRLLTWQNKENGTKANRSLFPENGTTESRTQALANWGRP